MMMVQLAERAIPLQHCLSLFMAVLQKSLSTMNYGHELIDACSIQNALYQNVPKWLYLL